MAMLKFALLLLVGLIGVCIAKPTGDDDLDTKVLGGRQAAASQYPFQVSIQYNGTPGVIIKFCGGVVLNPTWILTAAHCFDHYNGGTTYINAGVVNAFQLDGTSQRIAVDKRIIHPDYDKEDADAHNDICLLKLTQKLKFNKNVQPISLPPKGSEPSGKALVIGWGATDVSQTEGSNVQLFADVTVLAHADCQKFYTTTDKQVCIGGASSLTAPCAGDSGGPLVQKNAAGQFVTVGIVSWGATYCGDRPDIFTKVSAYIDYIDEVIKKN